MKYNDLYFRLVDHYGSFQQEVLKHWISKKMLRCILRWMYVLCVFFLDPFHGIFFAVTNLMDHKFNCFWLWGERKPNNCWFQLWVSQNLSIPIIISPPLYPHHLQNNFLSSLIHSILRYSIHNLLLKYSMAEFTCLTYGSISTLRTTHL